MNGEIENIGARRLQTVMEKLLEEVSFDAEDRSGETLTIDAAYVESAARRASRATPISAGSSCSAIRYFPPSRRVSAATQLARSIARPSGWRAST